MVKPDNQLVKTTVYALEMAAKRGASEYELRLMCSAAAMLIRQMRTDLAFEEL